MPSTDTAADAPIRGEDDLLEVFHGAEKPRERWRIGLEAEKFGVDARTAAPLTYEGERSVLRIFASLVRDHGWQEEPETRGGPVIALRRGRASITLEPAGQVELSGAPQETVHEVCAELRAHLTEIAPVSREIGVAWLGVGFQPFAKPEDLSWVPKQRYRVMRRYLPTRGSRALDMMQRTATVQANFDYASEADAVRKMRVMLRLSPVLHAMTANAPFFEGGVSSRRSERGDVWLHMDPTRSGLIPALWDAPATYRTYVEWALDAGMFLFKRGDRIVENTGQTFRSFLRDGFEGHRAQKSDWLLHLGTLFPEVRLKTTLEVRCADTLPERLAGSIPAISTGVLYDDRALDDAEALMAPFDHSAVESARPELVTRGVRAVLGGASVRELAERLLEIARGGLERRSRRSADGADESVHLDALAELVHSGRCPADTLVEGLSEAADLRTEILRRAAI